jgi:hypothetical protein
MRLMNATKPCALWTGLDFRQMRIYQKSRCASIKKAGSMPLF